MFTIGDFARHGTVSIRMLRHYDAIGLLRPAHVDPFSGYRFYSGTQLARLNRVIALKELGFTLQQVRSILDEQVSAEELRGMLRLRRAELAAAIEADAARLARVEARLRTIESEGRMSSEDVVVKRVEPVRVAELSGSAAGFRPEDISPVIQPLYQDLFRRLGDAGVQPTGPSIAYYERLEDKVVVHAGVQVAVDPSDDYGFQVVDLPAIDHAATIVHRGSMDDVMPAVQALGRWIDENGYRSTGHSRELYLVYAEDKADWVTEIQEPVEK